MRDLAESFQEAFALTYKLRSSPLLETSILHAQLAGLRRVVTGITGAPPKERYHTWEQYYQLIAALSDHYQDSLDAGDPQSAWACVGGAVYIRDHLAKQLGS